MLNNKKAKILSQCGQNQSQAGNKDLCAPIYSRTNHKQTIRISVRPYIAEPITSRQQGSVLPYMAEPITSRKTRKCAPIYGRTNHKQATRICAPIYDRTNHKQTTRICAPIYGRTNHKQTTRICAPIYGRTNHKQTTRISVFPYIWYTILTCVCVWAQHNTWQHYPLHCLSIHEGRVCS